MLYLIYEVGIVRTNLWLLCVHPGYVGHVTYYVTCLYPSMYVTSSTGVPYSTDTPSRNIVYVQFLIFVTT